MSKILIVDDEPHIRLLLEQVLEDFEDDGVELLTASNGKEALEAILNETPDIVFLDIMMPQMNGYEVCQIIKKEKSMNNVYIIMLTAKGQEFEKKKGLEVGADIYMTKPFDPDYIVETVTEILSRK